MNLERKLLIWMMDIAYPHSVVEPLLARTVYGLNLDVNIPLRAFTNKSRSSLTIKVWIAKRIKVKEVCREQGWRVIVRILLA
jgi:hypothetical protein